jgi:hypothetical protein
VVSRKTLTGELIRLSLDEQAPSEPTAAGEDRRSLSGLAWAGLGIALLAAVILALGLLLSG